MITPETPRTTAGPLFANPDFAASPSSEMPDLRHRNRVRAGKWQGRGAGADRLRLLQGRSQARFEEPLQVAEPRFGGVKTAADLSLATRNARKPPWVCLGNSGNPQDAAGLTLEQERRPSYQTGHACVGATYTFPIPIHPLTVLRSK